MAIASVGSFLTHVQYCRSNRICLLSVTIPRVFQMPCALRFLFSPSLSAYLPPSLLFVLILCFQMCLHVAVNVPSVYMCVCVDQKWFTCDRQYGFACVEAAFQFFSCRLCVLFNSSHCYAEQSFIYEWDCC